MNENKLTQFLEVFQRQLQKSLEEHPGKYAWRFEKDGVLRRTQNLGRTLRRVNHRASLDSEEMKATCKELGIKNTHKAIDRFLGIKQCQKSKKRSRLID